MCMMQAAQQVLVAVGTEAQAKHEKEAGDREKELHEERAHLADQAARDASVVGARQSQQSAWQTRALMGKQRATIAANGVDSDTGTAADILDETAMLGSANRSAIAMNAARAAWGFQVEATNERNQAKLARWEGHEKAKFTKLNGAMQSLSIWSNPMSSPTQAQPSGGSYGSGANYSSGTRGGMGTGPY